jgi:hypothetical protein
MTMSLLISVSNRECILKEVKYFEVIFNDELLFDSLNHLSKQVIEVSQDDDRYISGGVVFISDSGNDDLIIGIEHRLEDQLESNILSRFFADHIQYSFHIVSEGTSSNHYHILYDRFVLSCCHEFREESTQR